MLTLFALKWLHPGRVFLNVCSLLSCSYICNANTTAQRGNHETSDMNKVYGFEGEVKAKYTALTYSLFEEGASDMFAADDRFANTAQSLLLFRSPPSSPLRKRLDDPQSEICGYRSTLRCRRKVANDTTSFMADCTVETMSRSTLSVGSIA